MFVSGNSRLILVQPEKVLAELTAFRLELLGYGIEVFSTAVDAMASLTDQLPDLAIVDTTLADMDGIEWITTLRAEYTAEQLPVLMFSQDPSLETVERAFFAGAQDYVLTPYDPTVLEEKIERLLSGQFTHQSAE